MITKKLFPILISALLVLAFASSAQAEFFSISAGMPVSHSISNDDMKADGVSGYLVHVKLPIMLGLGLESYETKMDHDDSNVSDMKMTTTMYDIFWLTPIPIINFTIGAGLGTAEFACDVAGGTKCDDYYETGAVTQLWGQLGINVLPFIDLHVSYHQISGEIKGKGSVSDASVDGTLYAVGASIIF